MWTKLMGKILIYKTNICTSHIHNDIMFHLLPHVLTELQLQGVHTAVFKTY